MPACAELDFWPIRRSQPIHVDWLVSCALVFHLSHFQASVENQPLQRGEFTAVIFSLVKEPKADDLLVRPLAHVGDLELQKFPLQNFFSNIIKHLKPLSPAGLG